MKRIFKILGIILLLLSITVYFTYDYWLERELKYRLSEVINKDPSRLYEYSFEALNIHLLEGSVDLSGIAIKPIEAAYDSLSSRASGVHNLVTLNMEKIEMNGFEIRKFLRTGGIDVASLVVVKPKFEYTFRPGKKKTAPDAQLLSAIFSDKFTEANLGKLYIEDASISISDQSKAAPSIYINNLDIMVYNAHLDTISFNKFFPVDYESITVNADGIYVDANEDFSLKSDNLNFDVANETITLRNFQVNPKYTRENFALKYPFQKQWFAITLDSLMIKRINFNVFIESGAAEVGKILFARPNIALFKDKSKPESHKNRKTLPATGIKAIPWAIKVDTIQIRDGLITINEISPSTRQESNLTLNHLSADVLNFCNIFKDSTSAQTMTINASTYVMNKAATEVSMVFDLRSKQDSFKVEGVMGPVDGSAFNPVLQPMMGIQVTSGKINSVSFSFNAMDTLSIGTLDAEYENIKLLVLDMDSTTSKTKKGLYSFAANTVVKSNNIRGQANYLQGIISSDRVLEKNVWPFFWQSLQSGLVSTLVPIMTSKEQKTARKNKSAGK